MRWPKRLWKCPAGISQRGKRTFGRSRVLPQISRQMLWRLRVLPQVSRQMLWRLRVLPQVSRQMLWRLRVLPRGISKSTLVVTALYPRHSSGIRSLILPSNSRCLEETGRNSGFSRVSRKKRSGIQESSASPKRKSGPMAAVSTRDCSATSCGRCRWLPW